MADYRALERQVTDTLRLDRRPVAISFRDTPPAGVSAFTGVQPSGCSFWTLAADGRVFYTGEKREAPRRVRARCRIL